jgi:hypothetical protein
MANIQENQFSSEPILIPTDPSVNMRSFSLGEQEDASLEEDGDENDDAHNNDDTDTGEVLGVEASQTPRGRSITHSEGVDKNDIPQLEDIKGDRTQLITVQTMMSDFGAHYDEMEAKSEAKKLVETNEKRTREAKKLVNKCIHTRHWKNNS